MAGCDPEPDGALLGIEDLPVIGAQGLLVLPKRLGTLFGAGNGENGRGSNRSSSAAGPGDLVFLANEELSGWALECDRQAGMPDRLLDAAKGDRLLSDYVSAEVKEVAAASAEGVCDALETVPVVSYEQLKALGPPAPTPIQGPGILRLWREPRRREDCPVCAAEWARAMEQIGACPRPTQAAEPGAASSASSSSRRHRAGVAGGRPRTHSVGCAYAWFQQSLCTALTKLRFDADGNPRLGPISSVRVFPPPMMDVWSYWKQKGGRAQLATY